MLQYFPFDFFICQPSSRKGVLARYVYPNVFVQIELVKEKGVLDIKGDLVVEGRVLYGALLPIFSRAGEHDNTFLLMLPID